MPKTAMGLDVGSSSCHLVALDPEGRLVRNVKFSTSEEKLISAVAGLPGEVHVHLEASELAGWVRSVLKARVARIVISHAKTNAWIANDPLKSDRRDAFKLAELLRLGWVHEVYYPEDGAGGSSNTWSSTMMMSQSKRCASNSRSRRACGPRASSSRATESMGRAAASSSCSRSA